MLILMQCVAEAVVANGVKGLASLVPGGKFLSDVAEDALRLFRERRQRDQASEELRKMAEASFDEAKAAAEQIARQVAPVGSPAGSPEDRQSLELYLAQIPGAVRRSLRRVEDPTGKTIPAGFGLNSPMDLLQRLPLQMPTFRTGDRVPGSAGWTLCEPLGMGGFGEVWRATHDIVPQMRAIKFCTDPAMRQRLLTHEGKLISRVMREGTHPNVVGLIDAHLDGDAPWLAYEFVDGGDLTRVGLAWQKHPIAERVPQVVRALKQLADAAGRFHRLSPPIVHRDLKPANILYDRPTKKLRITDFGIGGLAAEKELASGSRLADSTRAAALLAGSFTPIYASPQQRDGHAPDPRDDVHALGVIAYQLLTGRFDQAPGPRFERDLKSLGVPDTFISLIGDCVDPEAKHRPADGCILGERLDAVLGNEPITKPTPIPKPTPQPERNPTETLKRNGWVIGIAILLVGIVLIVAASAISWMSGGIPPTSTAYTTRKATGLYVPPTTNKSPSIEPYNVPGTMFQPMTVKDIFAQIDLPPLMRNQPAPLTVAEIPTSLDEKYQTIPRIENWTNTLLFRTAVTDALQAIREAWGPTDGEYRLFRAEFTDLPNPKAMQQVVDRQKDIARVTTKLESSLATLEGVSDQSKLESRQWQLHYQYTVAQVKLRLGTLKAFNLALGNLRKEDANPAMPPPRPFENPIPLPDRKNVPITKDVIQTSMVVRTVQRTFKEGDRVSEAVRDFDAIIQSAPGTPWAALAKAYRELQLEFVPVQSTKQVTVP